MGRLQLHSSDYVATAGYAFPVSNFHSSSSVLMWRFTACFQDSLCSLRLSQPLLTLPRLNPKVHPQPFTFITSLCEDSQPRGDKISHETHHQALLVSMETNSISSPCTKYQNILRTVLTELELLNYARYVQGSATLIMAKYYKNIPDLYYKLI